MRTLCTVLLALTMAAGFSVQADAALQVIGTANYDSDGNGTPENYNLIYDCDGPFGPIVWLDYSRDFDIWINQAYWAGGLNGASVLTYNFNPGVTVTWDDAWRLPLTVDGPYVDGYWGPEPDGSYSYTAGYNLYNSEMGHLFYVELGNDGLFDTSNNIPSDWGLTNTCDFQNLTALPYWSDTEYSDDMDDAWYFGFYNGYQYRISKEYDYRAIAVRPGIAIFAITPEEQIEDIQEFFDDSVTSGDLAGLGATEPAATERLKALENMLEKAEYLIDNGYIEEACNQLHAIYMKTDGAAPPPDFVTGDAAAVLATKILELRDALGCPE